MLTTRVSKHSIVVQSLVSFSVWDVRVSILQFLVSDADSTHAPEWQSEIGTGWRRLKKTSGNMCYVSLTCSNTGAHTPKHTYPISPKYHPNTPMSILFEALFNLLHPVHIPRCLRYLWITPRCLSQSIEFQQTTTSHSKTNNSKPVAPHPTRHNATQLLIV